jgi:hypothetical protein
LAPEEEEEEAAALIVIGSSGRESVHPFYGRGKRNEEKGSKGSVGVRVEEWKECGKNR